MGKEGKKKKGERKYKKREGKQVKGEKEKPVMGRIDGKKKE